MFTFFFYLELFYIHTHGSFHMRNFVSFYKSDVTSCGFRNALKFMKLEEKTKCINWRVINHKLLLYYVFEHNEMREAYELIFKIAEPAHRRIHMMNVLKATCMKLPKVSMLNTQHTKAKSSDDTNT